MIESPPVDAGAVHDNATCETPFIVTIDVGAPEVVNGVTALEADEYEPLPAAFVATTLNLYDVPFVKPVTT